MKTLPVASCAILMSLMLAASASSQGGSYVRIAEGCPGSAGIPRLNAAPGSLPIVGETLSAELTNVPFTGLALGIVGLSITKWGTRDLPVDLTSLAMPGCFLYTDVRWTTGLMIAGGTATWDSRLPLTSEWIGRSFYQQVFVVDPGVPGLGAVMSDANQAVIGITRDVRLDTDMPGVANSYNPQIAASGNSVYVTWYDGRNGLGDIYLNRSIDGGATWLTSDIRLDSGLPGAANSRDPQIAASGNSVYVTWQDRRNSPSPSAFGCDIYFTRSLDGGATWRTNTRLDTDMPGAARSFDPQIVVSGNSVYVAWTDARNGIDSVNGPFDIYFNRSLNRGSTWLTSDIRLDTDLPGVAGSELPQIAASGNSVYVTWLDRRNMSIFFRSTHIYFNRSIDGGATWLTSDIRVNADSSVALRATPQIVATDDSVYVTWIDSHIVPPQVNSGTYFNRSLDGGVTWLSSDVRLDTDMPGVGSSLYPNIAASGNSVYVTWTDTRDGQFDIYFNRSLNRGSTWLTSDIRLDTDMPGVASSVFPKIVASGDSVYVTWQDGRNGLGDIYFNRSLDGGVTWLSSDVRLDTDMPGVAGSLFPQIAESGDSVYVTWQDNRTRVFLFRTNDIYFNRVFR